MVRRGDMMSVEDVTEIPPVDLVGVVPMMSRLSLQPIRAKSFPEIRGWQALPMIISATGSAEKKFRFRIIQNLRESLPECLICSKEIRGQIMSTPSVTIAKKRLKSLIVSDRMECTSDMIDNFTKDLYLTVSKIHRSFT